MGPAHACGTKTQLRVFAGRDGALSLFLKGGVSGSCVDLVGVPVCAYVCM